MAFLMGGYLAYYSKKEYHTIVILGTSVLGAYSAVRGVSMFFPGTFPPETEIIKKIAENTIDPIFFSYIAAFILTSAVGAYYQRRQKKQDEMTNYIKT
jgi:hypothetical protein